MASTRAFVGLGSNLGDRLGHLKRAVELLIAEGIAVTGASSVYETDPVGPPQPDYLNAAVAVESHLGPVALVALLKKVEADIGREQTERWGPRVIDLDLLLFGDESVAEAGIKVPHPELTNRAFALVPVLEIDDDVELPSGEPLSAFCEKDPAGIRLFAPPGDLLGG
ncbi:MAG TPA: 2-amino-4-hydroxy-6-hydroxymethyldihydropteridine diphosphokinase [Actinomycetota bacterium]|nr:2-amino-4-hydroxy-6-hydroxymethyldihydropteridine diphosphokinase [Actinomycetota bacterium]